MSEKVMKKEPTVNEMESKRIEASRSESKWINVSRSELSEA